MMKYFFAILTVLMTVAYADAQDLQHFNIAVLNQSPQNNIALLLPGTAKAIKPIQILTDINDDGDIYAATVTYPAKITLEQARQSINKFSLAQARDCRAEFILSERKGSQRPNQAKTHQYSRCEERKRRSNLM